MHPRARTLVDLLGLQPHPEGGYYREVFRSAHPVRRGEPPEERAALTTIYFLLPGGEASRWHRVTADEVWHHYEGDALELHCVDEGMRASTRWLLGPVGHEARPVHVVPAGAWQAARSTGAYTLVGCSVGPGFDFADFRLLSDSPAEAAALAARFPELASLL